MPIEQLGPYRVQRVLGHGGMGTVYSGVHRETGEQTAIKVLSDVLAADPRFRERFRGEVETLKKLRHKNIVTLHAYGEEDGRLFFVMELVHGQSLELDLRANRRFAWNEVADIGVQVCAALKHAHDHGVIHRDLKPANLLMTADGTVKLTDFGIAKFFGSTGLTVAGSMIGTPDYMSPEQTEGRSVTARSDLYSLGCVLYALLAGKPPFAGGNLTQVIDRVRFQNPVAIRSVVPDVPEEFDRIISQLLEKDPVSRIATPQMLANLLQAMQHALSEDNASSKDPDNQTPSSSDTTVVRSVDSAPEESSSTRQATSERPTLDFTPSQQHRFEQDERTDVARTQPSIHKIRRTRALSGQPEEPTATEDESKTHFTTVSDEDWRSAIGTPEDKRRRRSERLIVAVMLVGLTAIVAAFVVALMPPSADRLYERIQTLSRIETPPDKYENCMEEFLDRYPDDPRADGVQSLLGDYQCQQLWDGLLNKIRSLTSEEKLFAEGMGLADEGRLSEASDRFEQVANTLEQNSLTVTDRRLLKRAQHMLKKVNESAQRIDSSPNN
ncbi:MAG: serine/threonine protein kinase [Planctomycetes bacterium]|nr:serine/threonine protein kinase [Planctomycetota bacterium]